MRTLLFISTIALILFGLITVSQGQTQTQRGQKEQKETVSATDDNIHYYHQAVHLMKEAKEHKSEEDSHKISQGLTEIMNLAREVKEHEVILNKLHFEQEELKRKDWFWFLDRSIVSQVNKKQLEINDQERIILNLVDDITFHWRELKPIFSVQSNVFVAELLSSFTSIFGTLFGTLLRSTGFTLISFLIFGPVAFVIWSLAVSFGLAILPFILSIYWIVWLIRLPAIIIQYHPSLFEFIGIYGCSVFIVITVIRLVNTTFKRY